MTASRRVAFSLPFPLSLCLCGALALGGMQSLGCAGGGDDPGLSPDRCKARDCGPSSGGPESDPLDSDEEFDSDFPFPEDTASTDTELPGLDTAGDGAGDVAPLDSGSKVDSTTPDTTPVDTGIDTGPTCTVPTGKSCGWSPQCGCASGQNCDFTSTDGSVACVAAGAVDRNGKCTALGQCKKGLTCVGSLCTPFCNGPSDCTPGAGACHAVSDGASGTVPGMKVCMMDCDPRAPAGGCGTALGCDVVDDTTTLCIPAGTGKTAGSCTADANACAPGYVCVGTGDCRPWCRVGFPGDCSAGKTCGTFTTHPKVKGVEYGVCPP